MKKNSSKVVLFMIMVAIVSIFGFVASSFRPDGNSVYAVCQTATGTASAPSSQNPMRSSLGNVPFSIFTSTELGSEYSIVDYHPTFNTSGRNENMVASSIPYIFLSSRASTTLYVTFNTLDMTEVCTPPDIVGLQAQIKVKTAKEPNPIQIQSNIVGENNQMLTFALDLQNNQTNCPQIAGNESSSDPTNDGLNYLGYIRTPNPAESYYDTSYRTGLWEFNIAYMVKYGQNQTSYTLNFSFYVLDFADYVQETSKPLTISNTTQFTYNSKDTGYSVYNYNFPNPPQVSFDASKFAFGFSYSAGNNFFDMTFDRFEETGADTGRTGRIYLNCSRISASYVIDVYSNSESGVKYNAVFDFGDFEKNFIIPNSTTLRTSTMQGIYSFNLQLVARDTDNKFQVLDNAGLAQSIRNILSSQKVVIFGYDLRYNEDGIEKSLEKYDTDTSIFTTIASYNSTTTTAEEAVNLENEGNRFELPTVDGQFAIAKTNIAPLRFHSFGALTNSGAHFLLLKEQEDIDENINYLLGIQSGGSTSASTLQETDTSTPPTTPTLGGLKAKINNGYVYNRFSAITSDGVWLMWLDYSIEVPYEDESGDQNIAITGSQCVLFQIDNSTRSLGVHAITFEDDIATTAHTFGNYTQDEVRISIKEEPNAFYSPIYVKYRYASDYRNFGAKTPLQLKTTNDIADSYIVDGIRYNYYVTNNKNQYTFSNSGAYIVSIENSSGVVMGSYSFVIDKEGFENIGVFEAKYSSDLNGYIKASRLESSALSSGILSSNLYVTDGPFTLSWANKASGSQATCYVAYMGLTKDNSATPVMLDGTNGERYITNNYNLTSLAKNIETNYQNSINQTVLETNSYFKNEGLYFFYVYDECGNSFSLCVLVDNSSPEILQRKFGNETQSTFNPTSNPNNFQTENNRLYFGTHKALGVASKPEDDTIVIDNPHYLASYNLSNGAYIDTRQVFSFEFYRDILGSLSGYYISSPTLNSDTTPAGTERTIENYIVLQNELLTFYMNNEIDESFNPNTVSGKTSSVTVIAVATTGIKYSGEKDYLFVVKNQNGKENSRELHINFDAIQGFFFASRNTSSSETHAISRNGATNLDLLGFEYTIPSQSDVSKYYTLQSLSYQYYPYVYNQASADFSNTNYPYAKTPSKTESIAIPTSSSNKYTVNNINIQYVSQKATTAPGKYILTRIIRGGQYADATGTHAPYYDEATGEYYGGKYYYDETEKTFKKLALLEHDDLQRSYTVFVDRNGIISEENGTRVVGDNITLSLGNEDGWTFKDFIKKDNSYLVTNRLPVTLNVPSNKYFTNTTSGTLSSNYKFAKLNVTLTDLTRSINYIADGVDTNGYYTCSKLGGAFVFRTEGKYKLTITDNTGYNNIATGERNISPNTLEFVFEINTSSPQVDFYTTSTDSFGSLVDTKLQSEIGNDYCINTLPEEGNNVYATWSDSRTPYEANIDKIEISRTFSGETESQIIDFSAMSLNKYILATSENYDFITNNNIKPFITEFKVSFFGDSSTPYIYDGQEYYRYTYKLSLDLSEEAVYDITFSYKDALSYTDADGDNYASTYYSLTIDRTKPFSNIDNLLASESYLNEYFDNKQNFKEENFDFAQFDNLPSPLTYSFGISSNFTLLYDQNETANYFYIRQYNKYIDGYSSITPDMKHMDIYSDVKFAQYPKFSEDGLSGDKIVIEKETYYRLNYSTQTLAQQVTSLGLSPYGHFEIIEKDYAGNYRAYTVYIPQQNTSNVLHFAGKDKMGASVSSTLDRDITLRGGLEMTSLYSDFGWGVATIRNERTNTEIGTLILTPFTKRLDSTTIQALKREFSPEVMTKFTITLSRHNSIYNSVSKAINIIPENTDTKLEAPTITEITNSQTGETSYTITIPSYDNGSALYLDKFELQKYSQTTKTWEATRYSYTGKVDKTMANITSLSRGIYKAIYHDNYNTGDYYYILYVGEYYIKDEDEMFNFYTKHVVKDDIYYTGDDVDITYEGNLYKVTVNGILYSGTANEIVSPNGRLASYGCKRFTLYAQQTSNITAKNPVGGEVSYVINYYDITENTLVKTINVVINNYLPEISLKNASDGISDISSTLVESSTQITNSAVKINWGEITEENSSLDEIVSQGATAKLYFKDNDGKYKLYANLSQGQIVEDENYYRLDIINEVFGISRSVYFVIQHGDLPLYVVLSNNQTLSPSPAELLNLTATGTLQVAYYNSEATVPTSIINILYQSMQENLSALGLDYITSNNKTDFEIITRNMGFVNGEFSTNNISGTNVTKLKHYYSVNDMELILNTNMQLKVIEFCFKNNVLQSARKYVEGSSNIPSNVGGDYWTNIYLVYFLGGPIKIELFATTKVPKTSNLLNGSITFGNTNTSLEGRTAVKAVLAGDDLLNENGNLFDSLAVSWDSLGPDANGLGAYWFRQGNVVVVGDKIGVEDYEYTPEIFYNNGISTCYILPSGEHTLIFRDIAGNTHQFSSISSQRYYKLFIVDKVNFVLSYEGQTLNAIEYGVFNNQLSLVINDNFSEFYDINTIQISATRNGNSLTNSQISSLISGNSITFVSPGRYTVVLDGSYNNKQLVSNVYNFTLISSTSSRMAFEYPEIVGYQIEQVLRDNEDITSSFAVGGRVKSLFISNDDSRSGNGSYTVTLRYGSAPHQTLTFSFLISDFIPTLSCNIGYGETTTGNIEITFNAEYIYTQLGDCEVKIMVYNPDSNTFYQYNKTPILIDSNNLGTARKITLSAPNSYFVQVETASGNILTSFRVNKKEPLNFFAIVSIVVGVIILAIVIIIIIKLRTRMKVR
ncbi:MAG: hypothetical protein ACI4L7_00850 [Christensenellales bacterium]